MQFPLASGPETTFRECRADPQVQCTDRCSNPDQKNNANARRKGATKLPQFLLNFKITEGAKPKFTPRDFINVSEKFEKHGSVAPHSIDQRPR